METETPAQLAALRPSRSGGRETVAELRSRLRRAEMLLKLTQQCAAIDDLDQLLATLIEVTANETDAERGTLFLNDPVTGELSSRVAQGTFNREIRLLNTEGIAGAVFQTGRGEIVDDAYGDPRFNREIDDKTGFRTRSILCAPIKTVRGEIIGVVQTLNRRTGRFTEEDLQLLEAMAQQAATALQSTQYIERMRKTRQQEMEFLDLIADITSSLELSVLLRRVMSEATRMLKADRSTLFLNNEKTNELWSEVGEGLNAVQIKLPNTAGIAGAVFQSGKTINIPHAYADLRFSPAFDKKTGYFTRSILCVPVVNKTGKVIGVTQALNKRGGPFTAEDESRLKAFTAQVSIALENAKLFDDVQNMRNYNQSMLESMSNGVLTFTDEGRIHTCNAAGYRILKSREADVLGKRAAEFFTGPNAWLVERLQALEAPGARNDTLMDAELEVRAEKLSVNLTLQPLISLKGKRVGSLLMIENISNEKRMKSTMARYMDPGLAERLLAGGAEALGGQSIEATVLFSDIRSFTSLTEELGAQGTVALLNEYFTLMVECITAEGGMLDKFIGDAIMAKFGIPIPREDDTDRAVRTAIAMINALHTLNTQRQHRGQKPIHIGIGLNTDTVVSGNIGSPKRMEYAVIGDGVNLASRLESACKEYSAQILISEFTYRKMKGTYRTREVDRVVVKGKTEPVGVYEVLDYHTEETFPHLQETVNQFRNGLMLYRKGEFDRAISGFQEALKLHPGDKLSQTYIDRCEYLKAHPPEGKWDGVWVMKSK
ncbi:MAG TPA: GAF domain-containing protein [Lacunisphaera sp.]|nr:GAF domain-containing protein [Lacunisphaera sp.]